MGVDIQTGADAPVKAGPDTRLYIVDEQVNGETVTRLVEASHPSKVYTFLAKNRFHVSTASAKQVAQFMGQGVQIEKA